MSCLVIFCGQETIDDLEVEKDKLQKALGHYDQVIRGLDEVNEMLQDENDKLKLLLKGDKKCGD